MGAKRCAETNAVRLSVQEVVAHVILQRMVQIVRGLIGDPRVTRITLQRAGNSIEKADGPQQLPMKYPRLCQHPGNRIPRHCFWLGFPQLRQNRGSLVSSRAASNHPTARRAQSHMLCRSQAYQSQRRWHHRSSRYSRELARIRRRRMQTVPSVILQDLKYIPQTILSEAFQRKTEDRAGHDCRYMHHLQYPTCCQTFRHQKYLLSYLLLIPPDRLPARSSLD